MHNVLVRHLGCGDCLYLSSRERHRRVLVFWWNIQAGTRLRFGLLKVWRLALDDVKQPQESCNIVASTGEWLVYISNGVLISAIYISVYIGIRACLGLFRVSYAFFTLYKQ
jgi:hypothetical protein